MSMTRSEHDQRNDIPEVSRRGAHRPRGNPVVSLLPLLALGVLLVGVVSLAYVLFGRGGDADGTGDPVTAASVASSASPAASRSDAPAASSAASPATPSSQPSAGATPAGTVDKTTVLDFYNGSSPTVPGLSRTAAAEVKKAGWKIGAIESWTGPALARTTVYYRDAAQLATARAVIRELGVGVAKVNSTYATNGITVVISNDYTP